ncbi:aminoacyl-tRNA hydrolase [Corynebacterium vitaeruminis]|uniref:Peptidyl-tRNA hydrolase n=1 Tax=Corynebacterium vitaeruminis DSM 20294 TaxID=1224164 RepID=W5Y0C8_9CORY|nr:aminoacyl-tRNA hydrolase [Corynebacterium vitaeruminis]AHI22359.1 peptidyl-tRNA hydrolase [Corynebacterium vitaeruminis DSM 20294]
MPLFSRLRTLFARDLDEPVEWLVVGLGNPGGKYASTRHNVGYLGVDKLLEGEKLSKLSRFPALGARRGGMLVLRSTTYMNNSGEAVASAARRFGVPAERIIVLHDELDLPEGTVRLKQGGNENGHNGLKSISELLGTRDYLRVRMGISRPPKGMAVPDYVLSSFDAGDMPERAAEAVRLIVSEGLAKAQNVVHSR